ncbi:MAG: cob(I)yrinic acid a,c-diamide adenosyltransferase [Candidatus Nanoarchaeia archaeon]|nr:cob(I)yrinic acid a,c-diamide adenosyltransferase [Candidatus Nanoarchaeia archaeon]
MNKMKGNIFLITGNGAGKTASALGMALRACGHKQSVIMVQFMKGRKDIGEYKIQPQLKTFKVYQFGRKNFVDLKHPELEDLKLAAKGLEFIRKIKKWPEVLIIDELNLAISTGMLKAEEVISVLNKIPAKCSVFITGRYASPKMMEFADYVNEILLIKAPKEMKTRKGIEF